MSDAVVLHLLHCCISEMKKANGLQYLSPVFTTQSNLVSEAKMDYARERKDNNLMVVPRTIRSEKIVY